MDPFYFQSSTFILSTFHLTIYVCKFNFADLNAKTSVQSQVFRSGLRGGLLRLRGRVFVPRRVEDHEEEAGGQAAPVSDGEAGLNPPRHFARTDLDAFVRTGSQ